MSLKIKAARPKTKRRGDRLIVIYPEGDRYLYAPYAKDRRRVVEFSQPGEHYDVTYSPSGKYALLKGHAEKVGGPSQLVMDDGFWGDVVACRQTDEQGWMFYDRVTKKLAVSITHIGIRNAALMAAAYAGEIPEELAAFLGVHRTVCNAADIKEFRENPRYRDLRDFVFEYERPDRELGRGRRAENRARHELTNYDDMLRAAGGLLWPEQYERVRSGVDRIVAEMLVGGAR